MSSFPTVEVQPDPVRRWLGRQAAEEQRRLGKWYPQTQSQFDALENEADILLLSGTAGSLKTSTMLIDGIQDRESPKMNAYFFRKTYPAMEDAMRQAHELFPQLGFRSVDTHGGFSRTWRTPAGGTFSFRQLANKKDLDNNWGKEISTALFDETSQWEEEYPRVILSRNRSSDPDLKIRARFGTNPGNIGMHWIMNMFFNGVCPHCKPSEAPQQGLLRWDGKWPVAGTKLEDPQSGTKLSISYILGNVRDHNLLGPRYMALLRMQNPSLAAALEVGCWTQFEGQYFDIWNYDEMTVPIQTIPIEWWWPHWTGSDYGYSGSAAASVLFTRSPEGTVYALQEYPAGIDGARRQDVRTFAKGHYDALIKFDKEDIYTQPKTFETMYLGRDSWAERGDERTLAGQMNETLLEHDLAFVPIGDDRAGSAQLTYTMLRDGQLKIARNCTNLIESISSRIHDEKKPMQVEKQPGSHLCDYFDAFCHGLYGYLGPEVKPTELRIQERMKKIIEEANKSGQNSMSATNALLQYNRVKREEEKEEDEPVYIGSSARKRMQHRH